MAFKSITCSNKGLGNCMPGAFLPGICSRGMFLLCPGIRRIWEKDSMEIPCAFICVSIFIFLWRNDDRKPVFMYNDGRVLFCKKA